MGVRPNLLPVISQDKVGWQGCGSCLAEKRGQVTIDKAMLPALYQPFRKEREHPYGWSLTKVQTTGAVAVGILC